MADNNQNVRPELIPVPGADKKQSNRIRQTPVV